MIIQVAPPTRLHALFGPATAIAANRLAPGYMLLDREPVSDFRRFKTLVAWLRNVTTLMDPPVVLLVHTPSLLDEFEPDEVSYCFKNALRLQVIPVTRLRYFCEEYPETPLGGIWLSHSDQDLQELQPEAGE